MTKNWLSKSSGHHKINTMLKNKTQMSKHTSIIHSFIGFI